MVGMVGMAVGAQYHFHSGFRLQIASFSFYSISNGSIPHHQLSYRSTPYQYG